jgi:hypothetical protein
MWLGLEPVEKLALFTGSPFWYQIVMKKSRVSDTGKKRIGRPPVGAVPIMVRIPPADLKPIDDWIAKREGPRLSRPEAIRRLVELGLKAK